MLEMNERWFCWVMFETVWNRWASHSIFFGPLPCTFHVLAHIILVEPGNYSLGWSWWGKCQNQPGNFWNKWVVWVRITEQWANWEQNLRSLCKLFKVKSKTWDLMGCNTRYFKTHLTLDTVSAGDHCDLSMSRQIAPLLKEIIEKCENVVCMKYLLMFGW